jgi:hypothetical protein
VASDAFRGTRAGAPASAVASFAGTAALALALAYASTGTVQKYAGTAATFAYAVAMLGVVPLALRTVPSVLARLDERTVYLLAALTFVGLAVAFALVYPHANAHATASGALSGSDRDEDADVAVRALLHGRYPYDTTTYLGNHPSHMPGSLLLALPFAAVWTSALQNLFWLPVFFLGLSALFRDARVALAAIWLLVFTSPGFLREFLTGGDLIAAAIYVLLPSLALLRLAGRTRLPLELGLAAFLGVALSSRENNMLVLPLVAAALWRIAGARVAARVTGTAALAFLVVTLPFVAYDPAGFTPLHVKNKLVPYRNLLPHAEYVVPALTVFLALALCTTRMGRAGFAFARNVAIYQAMFVVVVVLASIESRRPDFGFLLDGHGLDAAIPALVAALPLFASVQRQRDA